MSNSGVTRKLLTEPRAPFKPTLRGRRQAGFGERHRAGLHRETLSWSTEQDKWTKEWRNERKRETEGERQEEREKGREKKKKKKMHWEGLRKEYFLRQWQSLPNVPNWKETNKKTLRLQSHRWRATAFCPSNYKCKKLSFLKTILGIFISLLRTVYIHMIVFTLQSSPHVLPGPFPTPTLCFFLITQQV